MIQLAVNGTLMRGLELNQNLLQVGASFVREAQTMNIYRLFSINDVHTAMYRVDDDSGQSIALEIWQLDGAGLISVLANEPAGLCIGKVQLEDGSEVLGVLGEQVICQGQKEITQYESWRTYVAKK